MKKNIYLVLTLFFLLIIQSCKSQKQSTLTWGASEYKYNPNSKDSIYITSFKNNISTFLSQDSSIKYILTKDSLIVYEGINIKKYFPEFFECYKNQSGYLNIYRYYYSNEFIFEKCYYNNQLEYEKVNVNGVVQIRNVSIGTKF